MALNPEAVGSVGEPYQISWSSKDSLLYAVSLNVDSDQLQYVTENSTGVTQKALPTMPVVLGYGQGTAESNPMRNVGEFNFANLVHASQAITLHQPLPVEGTATVQSKLVAMYDKVKAAVIVTEAEATDAAGKPLYSTRSSVLSERPVALVESVAQVVQSMNRQRQHPIMKRHSRRHQTKRCCTA